MFLKDLSFFKNLIEFLALDEPVFDGLGTIIGYINKYNKDGKIIGVPGVLDSKIIEVYAKKLNSGSDEEYLSVEIFEV